VKGRGSLPLAIALIAFAAQSAVADQRAPWSGVFADQRAAWSGAGTMICGDVTQALGEHPEDENLFFSWAQGFMSELNTPMLKRGETDLNGESMSEQKQFIKSYCKEHPRANYFEPVLKLYEKMRQDQGLPSYIQNWQEPNSK
jgi:hypothetical protein